MRRRCRKSTTLLATRQRCATRVCKHQTVRTGARSLLLAEVLSAKGRRSSLVARAQARLFSAQDHRNARLTRPPRRSIFSGDRCGWVSAVKRDSRESTCHSDLMPTALTSAAFDGDLPSRTHRLARFITLDRRPGDSQVAPFAFARLGVSRDAFDDVARRLHRRKAKPIDTPRLRTCFDLVGTSGSAGASCASPPGATTVTNIGSTIPTDRSRTFVRRDSSSLRPPLTEHARVPRPR